MIEPRAIYSRKTGKLVGWQARWYGPDGKQHAENGFRTKTLARKHARDKESDRDNNRYKDQRTRKTSGVPTVAEYVIATEEQRWAILGLAHSTREAARSAIRTGITRSMIGPIPVDQVRRSTVKAWLAELAARGNRPAWTRDRLLIVRRVYDSAVEDDDLPGIEYNPTIGKSIVVPARTDDEAMARSIELPTVEQLHALADRMPGRYRAMIYVQAGLGLRIGELCGLRKQDCNFLRREVDINGQALKNFKYKRGEPKRGQRRTLIMQRMVQLVLSEHMNKYPLGVDNLIFSNAWKTSARIPYSSAIREAADACAAEDPTFPRHLVSHHLRHMESSVSLRAGTKHAAAAKRLGHKNTRLLVSTYEHDMPGQDEEARALLDTAWGGESGAIRAATGENVDPTWIQKPGNRG